MASFNFSGKRALVTGAGKGMLGSATVVGIRSFAGIGRDCAILLLQSGAHVVAVSRTQEDLDLLKKEVGNLVSDGYSDSHQHPAMHTIFADLADEAQVKRVADEAGEIDLLVNNAGISRLASFLDVSMADFDASVASVHCLGTDKLQSDQRQPPLGVPSFPAHCARHGGTRPWWRHCECLVAGLCGRPQGPCVVLYAGSPHVLPCVLIRAGASKAGLDHLTRVMALELGPSNVRMHVPDASHTSPLQIRVNAVNPTVVLTAMGKMGLLGAQCMCVQVLTPRQPGLTPPSPAPCWPRSPSVALQACAMFCPLLYSQCVLCFG